jgi:molybdenum cofactor biosynthesis enzyme MoaA
VSETLPDRLHADPGAASGPDAARLPLRQLTSLWFQVTGLLCNLECTHCLVDSSPRNRSLAFLERAAVRACLDEAEALGVREIYFTGGEPFLHREMVEILQDTLERFPATVLTNGTLITPRTARRLGALAAASRFSLEIRVSLDHPRAAENDRVRGAGAFAKALRAVLRLQEAGLLPIVTATDYLTVGTSPQSRYDAFLDMLRKAGVRRPRLKVIPVFPIGKLENGHAGEVITPDMMCGIDPLLLQCAETRAVAADGVYACPILVGKRVAHMGTRLGEALGEVPLAHHACLTCYETGMTCSNF